MGRRSRRKRSKWGKYLKVTKTITSNPIVRGVVSVIPYGSTALMAIDAGVKVADKLNKKDGAKKLLSDPKSMLELAGMVGGGETRKFLESIVSQKEIQRAVLSSKAVTRKAQGIVLTRLVNEELQNRRFMPGAPRRSLKEELSALKSLAAGPKRVKRKKAPLVIPTT